MAQMMRYLEYVLVGANVVNALDSLSRAITFVSPTIEGLAEAVADRVRNLPPESPAEARIINVLSELIRNSEAFRFVGGSLIIRIRIKGVVAEDVAAVARRLDIKFWKEVFSTVQARALDEENYVVASLFEYAAMRYTACEFRITSCDEDVPPLLPSSCLPLVLKSFSIDLMRMTEDHGEHKRFRSVYRNYLLFKRCQGHSASGSLPPLEQLRFYHLTLCGGNVNNYHEIANKILGCDFGTVLSHKNRFIVRASEEERPNCLVFCKHSKHGWILPTHETLMRECETENVWPQVFDALCCGFDATNGSTVNNLWTTLAIAETARCNTHFVRDTLLSLWLRRITGEEPERKAQVMQVGASKWIKNVNGDRVSRTMEAITVAIDTCLACVNSDVIQNAVDDAKRRIKRGVRRYPFLAVLVDFNLQIKFGDKKIRLIVHAIVDTNSLRIMTVLRDYLDSLDLRLAVLDVEDVAPASVSACLTGKKKKDKKNERIAIKYEDDDDDESPKQKKKDKKKPSAAAAMAEEDNDDDESPKQKKKYKKKVAVAVSSDDDESPKQKKDKKKPSAAAAAAAAMFEEDDDDESPKQKKKPTVDGDEFPKDKEKTFHRKVGGRGQDKKDEPDEQTPCISSIRVWGCFCDEVLTIGEEVDTRGYHSDSDSDFFSASSSSSSSATEEDLLQTAQARLDQDDIDTVVQDALDSLVVGGGVANVPRGIACTKPVRLLRGIYHLVRFRARWNHVEVEYDG